MDFGGTKIPPTVAADVASTLRVYSSCMDIAQAALILGDLSACIAALESASTALRDAGAKLREVHATRHQMTLPGVRS